MRTEEVTAPLLLAGRLEAIPVAEVIQILASRGHDGLLTVEKDDGRERVEIEFEQGRIVRARLASRESLIAKLIHELEHGASRELYRALTEEVEVAVATAISWSAGLFRFRKTSRSEADRETTPRVFLEPQELLLDAAKRWDELTERES